MLISISMHHHTCEALCSYEYICSFESFSIRIVILNWRWLWPFPRALAFVDPDYIASAHVPVLHCVSLACYLCRICIVIDLHQASSVCETCKQDPIWSFLRSLSHPSKALNPHSSKSHIQHISGCSWYQWVKKPVLGLTRHATSGMCIVHPSQLNTAAYWILQHIEFCCYSIFGEKEKGKRRTPDHTPPHTKSTIWGQHQSTFRRSLG